MVTGAGVPPAEPWRDGRARWCAAALLARGVAPPTSAITAAAAGRAAASYAADTYGDPLVGHLVARLFLPGGSVDAAVAAFDALNEGDALWSLPPVGDVEGLGSVDDAIGGRLAKALADGRLSKAVSGGAATARAATSCLAALALDWVAARCYGSEPMLRSFVTTAPRDELAAVLGWGGGEGEGGSGQRASFVAARAAKARAAAAGNADLEARVDEAERVAIEWGGGG